MKVSITLSVMAFIFGSASALPQNDIFPTFVCPPDYPVGGCCKEFTSGGIGAGCRNARILINGAQEDFTCDDSIEDAGIPSCCTISPAQIVPPELRECVAGPQR